MTQDVKEKVLHLFRDYSGAESVSPEQTFESLNLDSLDKIEMSMEIEDMLNIEVADEEVDKFTTVQSVIDAATRLVENKSAKNAR